MRFIETAWRYFRNLEPRRQEWCPGFNIILGPNGSGKTNLLEALNVLCGWGAFEGGKLSSLPAWNSIDRRALLTGQAVGEREVQVEVQIGARTGLQVGNERVTHSVLRGLLPSLSFLPGDAGLLDGSPATRRFFLDRLCTLCSPLYARRLAEYKQLLRHRTRSIAPGPVTEGFALRPPSPHLLEVTGLLLARFGGWIRGVRRRAVVLLTEKLSLEKELLPCAVELSLLLKGTCHIENLTEDMERALAASLEHERRAKMVLVGPHRDDLLFSCGGRPASLALSRGQKRRVVMAVILAAGQLIEEKLRTKPILILDDIAAELDAEGRELMGSALVRTGWQVFASAAGASFAPLGETSGGAVWRVQAGRITG